MRKILFVVVVIIPISSFLVQPHHIYKVSILPNTHCKCLYATLG